MSEQQFGWHFVGETLRDGRPIPADGEQLEYHGKLAMCKAGLHWSKTPWEALQYAPGATLCYVELEDTTLYEEDKGCSRCRRILKRVDLTDTLRAFARQQALEVIHLWDAPDVVREYLETGHEDLRAAAWAAVWAAAVYAAGAAAAAVYAARDAAWAAARDATWVAARDATWVATRAAAVYAAVYATRAAAAAGAAAGVAARDATRVAARDAVGAAFNTRVYEIFEMPEVTG